jgi:DNA-directed RNA polymerase specialized sigma24 family protein
MTLREIAAAEGTSVNAVAESLMAARKKLEKYRKNF